MNKLHVLFSFLFFLFLSDFAFAQPGNTNCGTCTVDSNCPTLQPGGGLCPEVIPNAQVGEAYDETVTFYMPEVIQITDPVTADVTLLNVDIVELVNLPTGLEWSCNMPSCIYQPSSNPPTSELGCIQICGTPDVAPGNYTITIRLLADVSVAGFGNVDDFEQTYTAELTVLPPEEGIAFSEIENCGSLGETLTAVQDFNPDQPTTWSWDIGDGQSHTDKEVTYQYNSPGVYDIILETTVSNYVVTNICVSDIEAGYCGDVEEAACGCHTFTGFPCPDPFITITGINLPSGSDVNSHCWSNLSIPTGGLSFDFTVWDEDESLPVVGSPHDDLGNFTININNGVGDYNFNNGNLSGVVTIGLVVGDTSIDTLTVTVHDFPEEPVIAQNVNDLSVANPNGHDVQWYLDGNAISGADADTYTAAADGDYSVIFTDANGCTSTSQTTMITVGTQDITKDASITSLYPNPASDNVFLEMNIFETHDLEIRIMDITGRILMIENKTGQSGTQIYDLNISELNSGLYFVQVILDNGSNLTQKLSVK